MYIHSGNEPKSNVDQLNVVKEKIKKKNMKIRMQKIKDESF